MDQQPSATLSGTVEKIVKSPFRSVPEKAQIAVEGAERQYKEIRIDNALTDRNGEQVHLETGEKVQVKVTAESEPVRFGRW